MVHHTQPKKRPQRSTTSYSLRRFPTSTSTTTTDNHSAPLSDPPHSDPPAHPQTVIFADEAETNADDTTLGRPQQPNENGFSNASNQIFQRNEEENDYDPKLSELRATTNNGVDADNLVIHVQQANISAGNGHLDGDSKVDAMDPVQSDRRRGAKRRKSGSVKRFKYPSEPVDTEKAIGMSVGTVESCRAGMPRDVGNNSHGKNGNAGNIVKIIKPIGYSASLSGNTQDVLVTFIAVR